MTGPEVLLYVGALTTGIVLRQIFDVARKALKPKPETPEQRDKRLALEGRIADDAFIQKEVIPLIVAGKKTDAIKRFREGLPSLGDKWVSFSQSLHAVNALARIHNPSLYNSDHDRANFN